MLVCLGVGGLLVRFAMCKPLLLSKPGSRFACRPAGRREADQGKSASKLARRFPQTANRPEQTSGKPPANLQAIRRANLPSTANQKVRICPCANRTIWPARFTGKLGDTWRLRTEAAPATCAHAAQNFFEKEQIENFASQNAVVLKTFEERS